MPQRLLISGVSCFARSCSAPLMTPCGSGRPAFVEILDQPI